mmetsp:Transcript_16045/g.33472  ORF Transcript_16045/g.33472 Transcript_16045/m.33472 type:complete len:92 (-) Transcript_16045:2-277(-)
MEGSTAAEKRENTIFIVDVSCDKTFVGNGFEFSHSSSRERLECNAFFYSLFLCAGVVGFVHCERIGIIIQMLSLVGRILIQFFSCVLSCVV